MTETRRPTQGVIAKLMKRVASWLQSRCPHDPENVSADILDGGHDGTQVQWCHECGAVRMLYRASDNRGDWRTVLP